MSRRATVSFAICVCKSFSFEIPNNLLVGGCYVAVQKPQNYQKERYSGEDFALTWDWKKSEQLTETSLGAIVF